MTLESQKKWSKVTTSDCHIILLSFLILSSSCMTIICNNDLLLSLQLGTTPLHTSCINGHSHIVKLLIERGADMNVQMKVQIHYYVTV